MRFSLMPPPAILCRTDVPRGHGALDLGIGFGVVVRRVVQQQEVYIAEVELLERLINGARGMRVLVWVELRRDEHVLARYAALADGTAHFPFVVVHVGRVYQPVAALERRADGTDASFTGEAVRTEAKHRNIVSAAQPDKRRAHRYLPKNSARVSNGMAFLPPPS